jgi:hypothetical protein
MLGSENSVSVTNMEPKSLTLMNEMLFHVCWIPIKLQGLTLVEQTPLFDLISCQKNETSKPNLATI